MPIREMEKRSSGVKGFIRKVSAPVAVKSRLKRLKKYQANLNRVFNPTIIAFEGHATISPADTSLMASLVREHGLKAYEKIEARLGELQKLGVTGVVNNRFEYEPISMYTLTTLRDLSSVKPRERRLQIEKRRELDQAKRKKIVEKERAESLKKRVAELNKQLRG
ncbi:MAG: hypothetical protein NTZ73_04460 [Candidatus Diapherotrites archaeon]|nr:hypothetical protein [Candidatus Diapherotrites archaeon]